MKTLSWCAFASVLSFFIGLVVGGEAGKRNSVSPQSPVLPRISLEAGPLLGNGATVRIKRPYDQVNEAVELLGKANLESSMIGLTPKALGRHLDMVTMIDVHGGMVSLDWEGADDSGIEQGATVNIEIEGGKIKNIDFYGTRF